MGIKDRFVKGSDLTFRVLEKSRNFGIWVLTSLRVVDKCSVIRCCWQGYCRSICKIFSKFYFKICISSDTFFKDAYNVEKIKNLFIRYILQLLYNLIFVLHLRMHFLPSFHVMIIINSLYHNGTKHGGFNIMI